MFPNSLARVPNGARLKSGATAASSSSSGGRAHPAMAPGPISRLPAQSQSVRAGFEGPNPALIDIGVPPNAEPGGNADDERQVVHRPPLPRATDRTRHRFRQGKPRIEEPESTNLSRSPDAAADILGQLPARRRASIARNQSFDVCRGESQSRQEAPPGFVLHGRRPERDARNDDVVDHSRQADPGPCGRSQKHTVRSCPESVEIGTKANAPRMDDGGRHPCRELFNQCVTGALHENAAARSRLLHRIRDVAEGAAGRPRRVRGHRRCA